MNRDNQSPEGNETLVNVQTATRAHKDHIETEPKLCYV